MAEKSETPSETPSEEQNIATSRNPYQPTTEPVPAYNTVAQPAPYVYQPQQVQQQQQAVPYQQNYGTSRYGAGRKAKNECCGWKKKTCLICWIVVGVVLLIVIALSAVGFYCLANGCSSSSKKGGGGNGILTCNCLEGDPDCSKAGIGEFDFVQKCKSKEEQCYQQLQYNAQGKMPTILQRGCRLNPGKDECIQSPNPYSKEECWCRSPQCFGFFQTQTCDRYCAGGTHKQSQTATSGARFGLDSIRIKSNPSSSLVYLLVPLILPIFPVF